MSLLVLTYSFALWSFLGPGQSVAPTDSLTIRVLDIQNPSIVQIYSPNSSMELLNPYTGETETRVQSREVFELKKEDSAIQVSWFESTLEASKFLFRSEQGSPIHIRYGSDLSDLKERVYRGTISVGVDNKLKWKHLLITNRVQIEDYVSGVIPREYPFAEIEGIKAQAVIARTYAIGAARKYDGYDLTDTEASQVYGGALAENFASRRAVFETRGEVVRYDGRLIEAVYSSTCGGHTANNEDVWRTQPVAYLRSKPDPFDEHSPYYRWELELDKKEFYEVLSDEVGFEVKDIKVGKRFDGGYLDYVEIKGNGRNKTTLRPGTIRSLANKMLGGRDFRSPHFKIDKGRSSLTFDGQGFGHGVGACQYGMGGMARQGHSYSDILEFFYTDVDISRLPETSAWPDFSLQPAFPEKAIEPTMLSVVRDRKSRSLKTRNAKRGVVRARTSWNPWGSPLPESLKNPRNRKVW